LNLYHCHFGLYIQKPRHLFLVLKASKSRQNGKQFGMKDKRLMWFHSQFAGDLREGREVAARLSTVSSSPPQQHFLILALIEVDKWVVFGITFWLTSRKLEIH